MYPNTTDKRKAGMARFRAESLKACLSALQNEKLSKSDRAHIENQVSIIRASQKRFGDV